MKNSQTPLYGHPLNTDMFAIVIYPDLLLRLQQSRQALPSANFRSRLMSCCHLPLPVLMNTVKPHFTDTHSIRTLHFYGQFALSLGKESPYIFSKFNLLYMGTPSIWTTDSFYNPHSVRIKGV